MCALQFSKRQFESSVNTDPVTDEKVIKLYVNHPQMILSWIETCQTVKEKYCETLILQQGLDYTIKNDPEFNTRFIFENDSPEDLVF